MKSAIIVFPGTNREKDMCDAITQTSDCRPDLVWHKQTHLDSYDLIIVPGGFSYGDYLRCGAMGAKSPIMREVKAKADQGVVILGVCNGFQILTEVGLLPGTLMRNAGLKFICKFTYLQTQESLHPFTHHLNKGQVIRIPVAHNEGNYFADRESLDRLEGEGRVVFRYCDETGHVSSATNLNGSQRNIAGIINERGNVLGMMPHPENAIAPSSGGDEGRPLFRALAEICA